MPSLVEDLQRHALDDEVSVSKLLRMSKVVASKLELGEFLGWIRSEVDGWQKDCPEYRKVTGQIKVWNPYHGWQPLNFEDPSMAEALSSRYIGQKVAELEMIDSSKSLQVSLPQQVVNDLMESMELPLQPMLQISPAATSGILEAVRNIILDWSLKLEQNGIIGEGLSFSPVDKKKAHDPQVAYYINRIENFAGTIGPVSGDVRSSSVVQKPS